ncbi:MAG: hypothetical protein V4737_06795 [Curtobacterium sp.]
MFLDESGTHAGSNALLAGAIVTPDVGMLEHEVVKLHSAAMSDRIHWETDAKRSVFAERGFHNFFVLALRSLDFRAHVAYSRRESDLSDDDLLANMYYTLARNICLRYRTEAIEFVFENESSFDSRYSKIIDIVLADLKSSFGLGLNCSVYIASKNAPALAVVDYVLAICAANLQPRPQNYEKQQLNAGLPAHLAHVIDFDRKVHQSARKGVELL